MREKTVLLVKALAAVLLLLMGLGVALMLAAHPGVAACACAMGRDKRVPLRLARPAPPPPHPPTEEDTGFAARRNPDAPIAGRFFAKRNRSRGETGGGAGRQRGSGPDRRAGTLCRNAAAGMERAGRGPCQRPGAHRRPPRPDPVVSPGQRARHRPDPCCPQRLKPIAALERCVETQPPGWSEQAAALANALARIGDRRALTPVVSPGQRARHRPDPCCPQRHRRHRAADQPAPGGQSVRHHAPPAAAKRASSNRSERDCGAAAKRGQRALTRAPCPRPARQP